LDAARSRSLTHVETGIPASSAADLKASFSVADTRTSSDSVWSWSELFGGRPRLLDWVFMVIYRTAKNFTNQEKKGLQCIFTCSTLNAVK